MEDGFEMREFRRLENSLLKLASEQMPKETRKLMNKEGNKLKKKTLQLANQRVNVGDSDEKKHTKYHKSIKKGRVYFYKVDGAMSIRVYSSAPHAHLIEYGHRMVTGGKIDRTKGMRKQRTEKTGRVMQKEGQEVFIKGKHVFEDAAKAFASEFYADIEQFVDDVIVGGVTK